MLNIYIKISSMALILSIFTGCAKMDAIKHNMGIYNSKVVSEKVTKINKPNNYNIRVEVTPDTLVSTAKNKNQNAALKYASTFALQKGFQGFSIVQPLGLKKINITTLKEFKEICQTSGVIINDGPKCGQFIYKYDQYHHKVLINESHSNSFSDLVIQLSNNKSNNSTYFNAELLLKNLKELDK